MNASNACNIAIGWQLGVLIFREHAIFKLYRAIIEQQFQAITRKAFLLLAIALVVLFSPPFFDTLDLCEDMLVFACHGGVRPFLSQKLVRLLYNKGTLFYKGEFCIISA